MADTGVPCRTYGAGGRPPFTRTSDPVGAQRNIAYPRRPTGGAATGGPADPEPAPIVGAGDHDAAGHAEGRRGGSGCGLVGARDLSRSPVSELGRSRARC